MGVGGCLKISPITIDTNAVTIDVNKKEITANIVKFKIIRDIFDNNQNGQYTLSNKKYFMIDIGNAKFTTCLQILFLNNLPVLVTYKNSRSYIVLIESEYFSIMRQSIIDSKF